MYDLHCHILAGIDDGANTIDDSLALIKTSIEQGVTHMVATPHIRFGRFDNNNEKIKQALDSLQAHIQDLPIQIQSAAEVHICPEIMMLAQSKKLPFIGKWQEQDLLLLELPNDHIPAGTDKLIKWLSSQNIKVMIAHPERYKPFRKSDVLYNEYVNMGCLFQLTAGAVIGEMGENAKAFALQWLQKKRFTIIASDCHNLEKRAPRMQQAFEEVTKLFDSEYAKLLCVDNPKLIAQSLFENPNSGQS